MNRKIENEFDVSASGLKIVVIAKCPRHVTIIEKGLHNATFMRVSDIAGTVDLLGRIRTFGADVIVVCLDIASRDTIEKMLSMSRKIKMPVVMFVDKSDQSTVAAAVEGGISAYVVDGLAKERVRSVLYAAIFRFKKILALEDRLATAESALAHRKIIDRAKGIIMAKRKMTEQQAYEMLRETARNHKKKIVDIARSILTLDQFRSGAPAPDGTASGETDN